MLREEDKAACLAMGVIVDSASTINPEFKHKILMAIGNEIRTIGEVKALALIFAPELLELLESFDTRTVVFNNRGER